MQWTRLPRPRIYWDLTLPIELIESGTKGRYHVIRLFHAESSRLIFYFFDSMRGRWTGGLVEYVPWSPSRWVPTQYQGLVFKGALHWLAQDGHVMAYIPNDYNSWLLIHRSQEMHHAFYGGDAVVSETLTFSMDHLRILQLVQAAEHQHLYIWTLVDYKSTTNPYGNKSMILSLSLTFHGCRTGHHLPNTICLSSCNVTNRLSNQSAYSFSTTFMLSSIQSPARLLLFA